MRNVPGNRRVQHQLQDNFDKVKSVTTEECHRIARDLKTFGWTRMVGGGWVLITQTNGLKISSGHTEFYNSTNLAVLSHKPNFYITD